MRILVLGHNGMLGNAVYKYLIKQNINVFITNERYPENDFLELIKSFEGEYIINCIGAIPQRTNVFQINYELPYFLDKYSKCKIINAGTDCESDTTEYGKSKKYVTEWIKQGALINTYTVISSIIGIEKYSNNSLLSWTISQNSKTIKGYTKAFWNGVTSLAWIKYVFNKIKENNLQKIEKIRTNCISKFELLNHIKNVYNLNLNIEKEYQTGSNKCIDGIYIGNIKDQLIELKNFYEHT